MAEACAFPPAPPSFWFGRQPELLDASALWMDDPDGGDPILIATVKRVYKPELLTRLCARANGAPEGGAA